MRHLLIVTGTVVVGALLVCSGPAQEVPAPPKPPTAEPPPDYSEFSRFLHGLVVKNMPKEVEDRSGWGKSIPFEPGLRLPNLRSRIKVGDSFELPHGLWKRARVWIDEPDKNLAINVRDFKKVDGKTYKLVLDAQAYLHGQGELMHWQKGLPIIKGILVDADAVMALTLECDVGVALKTKNFIPELEVTPKLTECKLFLQEFHLKEVDSKRIGVLLAGEQARQLGNDIKGLLQQVITQYEPEIKARANQAIADGIKDGKGTISAAALLKIFSSAPSP